MVRNGRIRGNCWFTVGTVYVALLMAAVGLTTLGCAPRSAVQEPRAAADRASRSEADSTSLRSRPEAMSLLEKPLYAASPSEDTTRLEAELAAARDQFATDPNDPVKTVWLGRRLGYLWRMREAIDVFTRGIERHPDYAPFYRHRGHRYISVREFDKAIVDLEKAAVLIRGTPDEIEPDGMPNSRNLPLTTTGFNVWYHLGVARYFIADYEGAAKAFQETLNYTRGFADNLVAVTDWLYQSLRRLGRHSEAAALLADIRPDMDIIENRAYHRRLLMYKGLIDPRDMLLAKGASGLDFATLGYGVGYWYLHTGQIVSAMEIFQQVVAGPHWPAFGYIASEVELAREKAKGDRTRFRHNPPPPEG